jgi:hypothetical protein
MPLDPHDYNIALHLAEAGARARSAGSAVPDSAFAAGLRDRLLSPPPDLTLGLKPRSRERRIRAAWSLPSVFRVPRLLPIAVAAVLLFAGAVAARELYVAISEHRGPTPGASVLAVLPPQSASELAFATTSSEPTGEPSLAPAPGNTFEPTDNPTPGPRPGPTNGATPKPTPKPTPVATSLATPMPTPVPTPLATPVPTPVPTPTPAPTVPDAPTGLSAQPGSSSGEIFLNWSAPSSDGGDAITDYDVCQADQQGGPYTCSPTGSTATATTISGLAPGSQYWYRIEAVNGVGAGPRSNEDTAAATP